MAGEQFPRSVPPGGGRAVWWLDGRGVFVATGDDTGGAFALWHDTPPPGGGPPPHVHTREEEFFYVLKGELVFGAGGQRFTATPGALVALPKGVPHRFANGTGSWAHVITLVAPAGNERLFLGLAAPADSPLDPTADPDPARLTAAAAGYGVTIFPPNITNLEAHRLPLGAGRTPTTREPGEGEKLAVGRASVTLKVTGAETDGAYTLAEIELPPGVDLPTLPAVGQAGGVFVLDGMPTVGVSGGGAVRSAAGGFVQLPPADGWAVRNPSHYPVRLLLVAAPAGLETALRQLA